MVNDAKGDTKTLSKVVNNLLGRDTATPLPADKSPSQLAGMFSDFFVQKVAKIRSSIRCDPQSPSLSPTVSSTFTTFQTVTLEEVTKLIRSSASKTCDLDPLPTSLVKDNVELLAPIITSIVNASLEAGTIPTSFKSAVVTPILKKSSLDPDNLKNYRPVSNLAFVSKLVEKLVASLINEYLNKIIG